MTMPYTGISWPADMTLPQYYGYQGKFINAYYKALEQQDADKSRRAKLASEFAESRPRGLYSQAISGLDKPVRRYFGELYNDVYDEYLSSLIKEAKSPLTQTIGGRGSNPITINKGVKGTAGGTFSDFLSNYDFQKKYMQQPYLRRGGYEASRLAPMRMRFLNF